MAGFPNCFYALRYPGGDASLRGPEQRILPDDFSKKISLGDRSKDLRQLLVEVRLALELVTPRVH